jgi:regulator of protease activity HflC (stomatin/prohibitin superfamily)
MEDTMALRIQKDQRGLLYKKGEYLRLLKPGEHFIPPFFGYTYEICFLEQPFTPSRNLKLYRDDSQLMEELHVIEVKDNQLVLHFMDERLFQVLKTGRYMFWKPLVDHTFITVGLTDPRIGPDIDAKLLSHAQLVPHLFIFIVEPHEKGLLFFDGQYRETLEPGKYYYWKTGVYATVLKADMRQQQLDMTGQEIMTKDKVTIRLNFICQYKILDPAKTLVEIKNYQEQLYILMQLILREYVGTFTLDEFLEKKEEIGQFVLEKLKVTGKDLGLDFMYAGVKDIILPGEIKVILNQVLEAEKRALANIITRREETASTRSLLNTAKLMENNPTLLKLKELEHIERISDKIQGLTLSGGTQILEQLKQIFGTASPSS